MTTAAISSIDSPRHPAAAGWRRFSIVRILLGFLAVALPVAATLILTQQLVDKPMRWLWPQLLAAALCVLGYRYYVHRVERRAMTEFGLAGAGRELGTGLLLGGGMFCALVAILAAVGAYRVTGYNAWIVMAGPFAEMVLVALVEEIVFRGVLQRNLERALGSWHAVWISAVVFGLAHLPNEHVTAMAIAVTFAAGLMFAAIYLVTRRLWLAVGTHFAWNFTSAAIFSTATSGHAGKGIVAGATSGPAWLSGGLYGVEGSVLTLVAVAGAAFVLLRLAKRRGQLMTRAEARAETA